jgi:predicted AAA+ superfamily ATPase
MAEYLPRIVDVELTGLLGSLPAVAVDGAKAVGKTSTAGRVARSSFALDNEATALSVSTDPGILADAAHPVLIDEWQRVPAVWDWVRRQVDSGAGAGTYILTGSAAPRGVAVHSGAGRLVRLRMRPLSLAERGIAEPRVSIAGLMARPDAAVRSRTPLTLRDYVHEITASGFPGIRLQAPASRQRLLDGYIATIASRELPEQGTMVRRHQALASWLRAYARATASTARYEKILDAAVPDQGDKPAKSTATAYRDALASLWLLDPVPAWAPEGSGMKGLGNTPKHFLADPAIAARLLRLTNKRLLTETGPAPLGPQKRAILGRLFEALVGLSLQTYARAADAGLFHLRTHDGSREIDFIIEGDEAVIAVEAKLSSAPDDRDVRHLNWLAEVYRDRPVAKVVATTGEFAYRRPDGVHVVPAALLGP